MNGMFKKSFSFVLFVILCNVAVANPLDLDKRHQTTVHIRYNTVIDYYQKQNWKRLAYACNDLIDEFPDSPFAREGYYYLGIAYYQLREFAYANKAFSNYLKKELSPKFFDQVMHLKFDIAQALERGKAWLSDYNQAFVIYDEIITTLPRDDLAAYSLYKKGMLFLRIKKYKESVETLQTLIRRFPKHVLAPESYLGIANVYLTRCENEFPDPDYLDLAKVNLRKFRQHFPGEPRIAEVENSILRIKEKLASDIFEVAQFYLKTGKKEAAIIYYSIIINKYPETHFSSMSQKSLKRLNVVPIVHHTIVDTN